MIIPIEKPGTPEELVHSGVKGMHWGVRKEEETSDESNLKQPWSTKKKVAVGVGVTVVVLGTYGAYKLHQSQAQNIISGPVIKKDVKFNSKNITGLETLPENIREPVRSALTKINDSYGPTFSRVLPIDPKEFPDRVAGTSMIDPRILHMSADPKIKGELLQLQKEGWFSSAPTHPIESIITHESAHSILHNWSTEKSTKIILKSAWDKTIEIGIKSGEITKHKLFSRSRAMGDISRKISQYGAKSRFFEETEAEIFSSYHWGINPPKFVDAFMDEIHRQLGIQVNPFSGRAR